MERRGETWRKTQKGRESCVAIQRLIMDFSLEVTSVRAFTHPLGSWHSGINAPSQGSGANAAPSGTYASGPQWVLLRELWRPGPTPLPKDPGVWVRTPAPSPADGPSLGAGLLAPPLAAWPLQRCLRMLGSCTTRRAPSDGREKEGARAAAGPSLISLPSSHAGPVGASVRMRSRDPRGLLRRSWNGRSGWVRQASELASRRRANRPKDRSKVSCGLRGLRWLTGVKHMQELTRGNLTRRSLRQLPLFTFPFFSRIPLGA